MVLLALIVTAIESWSGRVADRCIAITVPRVGARVGVGCIKIPNQFHTLLVYVKATYEVGPGSLPDRIIRKTLINVDYVSFLR